MQVTTSHRLLKKIENDQLIKKHYGKLANSIVECISILNGADSLHDVPNVPPTRRHKLAGEYFGCWGIDLDKRWRMVLRPASISQDLREITAIEIVEIVEYH